MNESLITIIVPVYNIEEYLNDCVTSIVNQTYHNLEIILVDDGSSDGSGSICDAWMLKDQRVRVVHKKNEGLSSARNTGISASQGAYIAFVDGDDIIHPNFISILYNEIISNDSKISVCDVKYCYNDKDYIFEEEPGFDCEVLNGNEIWDRFIDGDRVSDLNISCNKLYSKELFDYINFPVGRLHEDDATTYKLLFASQTVVLVHQALYYYRQREGSIVYGGYNLRRCVDIVDSIDERVSFFERYIPNYKVKISYYEIYKLIGILTVISGLEKRVISLHVRKLYLEIHSSISSMERIKIRIFLLCPFVFSLYLKVSKE